MEKHVVNPGMAQLLRLGLAPRAFALLETTGRRSGRVRQTPVGIGLDGDVAWLVAEHGDRCDYVKNLLAHPEVRMKIRRRWYSGRAAVLDGDDGMARRRAIDASNGVIGWLDGLIFRAASSTPCTVRIALHD